MTTKRKAELQRKLALAPVPRPPADLADRIKSEIPEHLMADTAKERARFRQAVAFNVRVAASIILLVSSVYLALHLLSSKFGPQEMASTAVKETSPAAPVVLPTTPPPPMSDEAKQQAQQRKPIVVAESRREMLKTDVKKQRDTDDYESTRETTNGRVTTTDGMMTTDEVTTKAEAPALAGAAPTAAAPTAAARASAPQPLPAPPPPARAADSLQESITVGASAPAVAPAKPVAVAFDVEGSAAPFDAGKQIVRVSVDNDHDALPDVAFNDDVVASWHTLASDGTSLYEITLRPHAGANEVIATARVNNMERVIRRGDLHPWSEASQRMKAASLEAALESGVPPKDVAAKARAAGLDDLAAAAEARAKQR